MRRLFPLLVTLSVVLGLPAVAAARPPDADAPVGASPDWLPPEEWVQERWLPFDQSRLYQVLAVDGAQVARFLAEGQRTLVDLARSRGVPIRSLVGEIVGPRPRALTHAEWTTLRSRTGRVLDQGHL